MELRDTRWIRAKFEPDMVGQYAEHRVITGDVRASCASGPLLPLLPMLFNPAPRSSSDVHPEVPGSASHFAPGHCDCNEVQLEVSCPTILNF